jgi:hypothetical protein
MTRAAMNHREDLQKLIMMCGYVRDARGVWFPSADLGMVLWLADSTAYLELGCSISGKVYVKQADGPMPAPMADVVVDGHARAKASFSSAERAIVDRVLALAPDSRRSLALSAAWRAAAVGDPIPYGTRADLELLT